MSFIDTDLTPITESQTLSSAEELGHFQDTDYDEIFLDIVKTVKLDDVDIRPAVIDGEIEDALDSTPTIRLVIHDPGWHLLNSGIIDSVVDMYIGTRWYRLDGYEINDDNITLIFIIRNAAYLMHHTNHKKSSRGKTTRAEFILLLVRTVKKVKIKFIATDLHKKQAIEDPDKDRKSRDKKRDKGLGTEGLTVKGKPADGDQSKNMEDVLVVGDNMGAPRRALIGAIMCITQESGCRRSATAISQNGAQVGLFQQSEKMGWPATRDPYKDAPAFFDRFIPIIKAAPSGADMGALIDRVQGSGIPSAYNAWLDEATNTVDAFLSGDTPKAIQYNKQYAFEAGVLDEETGERSNYLADIYRLADEVAWNAFWVKNELHYESQTKLFKSRPIMEISRNHPAVKGIRGTWDSSKTVNTMEIQCEMERWICPVGACIKFLEGTEKNTKGKWLVTNIRRPIFSSEGTISLAKPTPPKKEPASETGKRSGTGQPFALDTDGGAKSIVDQCANIAKQATDNKSYVGSDYRPGSITDSGNPSDHGQNSDRQAARDIGIPGIDLINGPPSPLLDDAALEIMKAFGQDYTKGQPIVITGLMWHGYRIQIFWRTQNPKGHMGHIHVGAKWPLATKPGSAALPFARGTGGQRDPSA